MKKSKRLLSMLMAIAMLFTMAVPLGAVAAETPSVTIDNMNPVVGDVLTAVQTPAGTSVQPHAWFRQEGDTKTTVGNSSVYTVTSEDVGATLSVRVWVPDVGMVGSPETAVVPPEKVVPSVTIDNMNPVVGDVLTAVLSPAGTTVRTNQWRRIRDGGTPEVLGWESTYTVTSDDVGTVLQLWVVLNSGESLLSPYTAVVPPEVNPTLTLDNTSPVVGDTIVATLDPVITTATYKWFARKEGIDIPIDGETANSFTVTRAEMGSAIWAQATLTGGTLVESNPTDVVPVEVPYVLELSNLNPRRGDTIVATLDPVVTTATYKWFAKKDGIDTPIDGETAHSFTVTSAEMGSEIWAQATLTGGTRVESNPTNVVPVEAESTLTIDNNKPKVGDNLTATVTPKDEDAVYQWYRFDVVAEQELEIVGAVRSTYAVTKEDAGHELFARATLSDKSKIETNKHTDRVKVSCNYGDKAIYNPTEPGKKPLEVGFNGSIDRFNNSVGVQIDGKQEINVPEADYTVTENADGIRVKLSTNFLDTLKNEKYFLHAYFKGGVRGESSFNVVTKKGITDVTLNDLNPQTGDTLTATVKPQGATVDYAWYAKDEKNKETVIPGANQSSYMITGAYVGYTIFAKVKGIGEYEGTYDSPATAPVDASCEGGAGQSYNKADPARTNMKFDFVADHRRLDPKDTVSCTDSDGNKTVLTGKEYSFELNTASVILEKTYLDTLTTGQYGIQVRFLGGATGSVMFTVVSGGTIDSVTISDTRPSVGDTLTAAVAPESVGEVSLTWWRTPDSGAGEKLGTAAFYKVKEEDVGYRIYVVANAAGSTAAGVQSPRTEPVWAVCSEGEGSSYNPGEDLVFRFNGALSSVITTKPIMVAKVGGKEVALKQSDYTIKSGSTIVTLKDSFLKTLSAGNYTLGVNYLNNVKAEARFTIKDGKPTPKPDEQPKTGDDSNLWLWVLLSSGAFLGLGTTLYLRKKQVK